jgi:ABC-type multidrug transport system ATPase subunit
MENGTKDGAEDGAMNPASSLVTAADFSATTPSNSDKVPLPEPSAGSHRQLSAEFVATGAGDCHEDDIEVSSKQEPFDTSLSETESSRHALALRSVAPVDVSVRGLSVQIDLKPTGLAAITALFQRNAKPKERFKSILDDVSASMPSGSITAIIGASGSGKTSFLNVLSRRMNDSRLHESGEVLYNGNSKLSSIRSAYVMQQDVLLPTLTVRETLIYAAELRLPPPTTAEERRQVVEEVILELGLKECANTRIGNNEHKGCSGGEKRRTSLAVQLLSNPSVLFLDEVTTGLDATSAHQLIRTLKQLAQRGRTIIATIHQPRSEIWGLFDHIVLLTGGSPVYSGPSHACLEHFEKLGHPLPPFVNPAEHLIDIAAVDNRSPELEEASIARVDKLKSAWRDVPVSTAESKSEQVDADTSQRHAGFLRQTRIQTARTFKTTIRDPMGMTGSIIECLSMAVLTGWIFLQLDGSLSGIRSRQGALYTAAALQGYLILLFETYRLTTDIQVFDRERVEGVVGVGSFLLSRRLARFFLEDLPIPLFYSVIFYFMCGFRNDAEQFFIFFSIVLLGQYLAVTLAMLCVAASRDFAGASLIANMNFTLQSMCSGFFVQSNQIPPWVRWLKYTAYVWYADGALYTNEFFGNSGNPAGFLYDCPSPGGYSDPACTQYTGRFIVASLGFPLDNWLWRPVIILVGFIALFYAGAYAVLTFYTVDMRISRAQAPNLDTSAGKEQMKAQSLDRERTLDLTLDRFSLDIEKRNLWGRKTVSLSILKPITTTFQPRVLNVIMGVSGGGKTSLLNLMARRLSSSYSTRYKPAGTMLFGGSAPSDEVVRSVASYVCQHDDALLPTLTVRETLHFAAQLRLPTFMSRDEKKKRAESVLLKLGLRDCADNLVGNDLVKGISGGEKRRVSIAVQILTDPKILLLDEPTSGLDAFTASSIMEVLRGLADEGRTVILTIHQSRSDLFRYFGNVLLLARGGHLVYAGPGSQMLPHFASLGHPCPSNVNPADFALDLISVDLQSSRREARTKEKVNSLITSWTNTPTSASHLTRATSHVSLPAELGSFRRKPTPFLTALPLLMHRSTLSFKRDPNAILARTSQVLGFGIIVTLFFAPLKSDFPAVQSRLGFLQEIIALYFVGMLQNVAVYPSEKAVFYNEHADGAYGVSAFFFAYLLLELPFEIVTSLLFSCLASLAAGLPRTVEVYFVIALNAFCVVSCGESVGMMFNTLFASTGFAVNLTSVVLSLGVLMSGVLSTNLASFLDAFNHLSPGKWGVANMAAYTLKGFEFTCTQAERGPDGKCPISTGEDALRLYNLDVDGPLNLVYLVVVTVGYRIAAYLLLKAVRSRWRWPWAKKHGAKVK